MPLEKKDVVCVLCGKSAKEQTIKHRNKHLSKQMAFHSRCVQNRVAKDGGNPVEMLRLLNIPYIATLWKEIEERKRVEPTRYITEYIKRVGPRHTAYPDFMASEFGTTIDEDSFVVTQEMRDRWGMGLSDKEYIILESKYQNLAELQRPTNQLEESRYITNAWLSMNLDNAVRSGTPVDIEKAQRTYEKDLKAIGLDSAAIQGREGEKSLGERIADWELNKPIPEPTKEFKDVDKIKQYFTKYFLIPMMKNFDRSTTAMENELNDIDYNIIPGTKGDDK